MIDLENPRVEQIDIRDIAHSLSLINRFTGHTRTPYSVAEHCVIGSEIIRGEFALEFLLHDAHEAYLGDVSGPLKGILGGRYAELADLWDFAIFERFDLDGQWVRDAIDGAPGGEFRIVYPGPWRRKHEPVDLEVHRIDKLMVDCELDVLMGYRMPLAKRKRLAPESELVMRRLETRGGEHLESRFLARYEELQLRRGRRGARAK